MGQLTHIKIFIHRYPERFSDLPAVTQQVSAQHGLGTVQVVMQLKCFGSDRRVQPKDVGPGAGSAAQPSSPIALP